MIFMSNLQLEQYVCKGRLRTCVWLAQDTMASNKIHYLFQQYRYVCR